MILHVKFSENRSRSTRAIDCGSNLQSRPSPPPSTSPHPRQICLDSRRSYKLILTAMKKMSFSNLRCIMRIRPFTCSTKSSGTIQNRNAAHSLQGFMVHHWQNTHDQEDKKRYLRVLGRDFLLGTRNSGENQFERSWELEASISTRC